MYKILKLFILTAFIILNVSDVRAFTFQWNDVIQDERLQDAEKYICDQVDNIVDNPIFRSVWDDNRVLQMYMDKITLCRILSILNDYMPSSYSSDDHIVPDREEMMGNFIIGFESLDNIADRDYNDLVVEITMPAPEPETLIILSIGILILITIRIYKKYNNQPKL